MRAQVGPSSKDLLTVADYEAFLKKDDVVVVGFFEKETDLKGEFLKTADKLREEVTFGHSSAKDVLEKSGYKYDLFHYYCWNCSFNNLIDVAIILSFWIW